MRFPSWGSAIVLWLACLLFVWGVTSILGQYRWYFPPDFASSDFLTGRRPTFYGIYQWAFFLHLVCGPIAIVLAAVLIVSGGHKQFRKVHRLLGRVLLGIVILGLVPSGIVMATQAFTGPIAGWGFTFLALATGLCTVMAAVEASKKRFDSHRRWALRSFILLCSPLILRFVATMLAGFELESILTYRLNAWLSWLIPIVIFECVQKWSVTQSFAASIEENDNLVTSQANRAPI